MRAGEPQVFWVGVAVTAVMSLQLSLRQMNQTRFYAVENRKPDPRVSLLLVGLPPLLAKEEYTRLVEEHLDIKSELALCGAPCWEQGWCG